MKIIHDLFDTVGVPVILGVFILLFILESVFQLRKRVRPRLNRIFINGLFSFPSFAVLRLVYIPALVGLAAVNQQWHFGINYWLRLSPVPAFLLGFILFDYLVYVWHRLTHRIPFLWRFHRVHHTDSDLDVTTAIRFHFLELLISVFFRGAVVLLLGVSPLLVVVYEIVFEIATNFHHSNWKLPIQVERAIIKIIVTPRMHGIHHSILPHETNSNYSTVFSFWDRLHKTLNLKRRQEEIVIGLPGYNTDDELKVWQLLTLPFRKNLILH